MFIMFTICNYAAHNECADSRWVSGLFNPTATIAFICVEQVSFNYLYSGLACLGSTKVNFLHQILVWRLSSILQVKIPLSRHKV